MEDFEVNKNYLGRQIKTIHRRGYSQTVQNSFCNSLESNFSGAKENSFGNFEINLLQKSKLVALAVPYKVLGRKIESVNPKIKLQTYIKVPLNKKLPFGKHITNEIEPKFKNILKKTRSIYVVEKKIAHAKMLSGRIN